MSNTGWEHINRLAFLEEKLVAAEQAERRARRRTWLCNLGIAVVWLAVAAAIGLIVTR